MGPRYGPPPESKLKRRRRELVFVEPVAQVVVDAVHTVHVAADAGAARVQANIGDAGVSAEARQVVERLVARDMPPTSVMRE